MPTEPHHKLQPLTDEELTTLTHTLRIAVPLLLALLGLLTLLNYTL